MAVLWWVGGCFCVEGTALAAAALTHKNDYSLYDFIHDEGVLLLLRKKPMVRIHRFSLLRPLFLFRLFRRLPTLTTKQHAFTALFEGAFVNRPQFRYQLLLLLFLLLFN